MNDHSRPGRAGLAVSFPPELEPADATELFRLALEAAPSGMILVDGRGRIVLVNARTEKLFGYPRAEVVGQPLESLIPDWACFGDPGSWPVGAGRELCGLRRDGTELPIEIAFNVLVTAEGRFLLGSLVDITRRKAAEREREELLGQFRKLNADLEQRVQARTAALSATLKEREVLLQEVHHRVKNNLQVISSLINMQARALREGRGRDALQECQTRVQAIALIHEQLYRSGDYAQVPFSEYARSLARNIFAATGVPAARVRLQFAVEEVSLAVDRAIPCGLILNELITNALKHAFPDERPGTIRVELAPAADGGFSVAVRDDGVGLPADLDARAPSTLGIHLVRMLAAQLDAVLAVETTGGTCVRLTVPGAR
jgi:two-component sensor histidine kinase